MRKKSRTHFLLSCTLVVSLTVGMLSGCSQSQTSEVSSQEDMREQSQELKGQNEDADSNLGAWGRAMGSVLISINDGSPYYFGGYAVTEANQKAAANILEKSWQITSRKKLLQQIQQLLKTGSRKEYLQEAKEMNALSAKELRKAMKQLSGSLLIHYELVQKNWTTWGKKGLLAWDMCRISHLVQWGYIAGYLNLEEAQAMIEPAAGKLRKQFTSWEDVIMNWLDGYALAASVDLDEQDNDYEKRRQVYLSLVEQQEQKGILYDDMLFQTEIKPLAAVSYTSILQEIKSDKKQTQEKKNPKKVTRKKKQQKDSEESIE